MQRTQKMQNFIKAKNEKIAKDAKTDGMKKIQENTECEITENTIKQRIEKHLNQKMQTMQTLKACKDCKKFNDCTD